MPAIIMKLKAENAKCWQGCEVGGKLMLRQGKTTCGIY